MAGQKLDELGFTEEVPKAKVCVKECVLPFTRFVGSDILAQPRDAQHR